MATQKRIVIETDGPYRVEGGVPLARKTQIVSEYGEPLTWKKEGTIETSATYSLCRCGRSQKMPFCDNTHFEIDFDGKETAETNTTAERQEVLGGVNFIVRRDYSLCMESGVCANRMTNIDGMLPDSDEPLVRAQLMAMVERCPSGSYVYAMEEGAEDIEPDLPEQIAVTTEITDKGPIPGALWVTGGIAVQRADGQPFETRNRVTLCCCGLSKNKPLCDGTHRP